ncbi:phospholipid/cholesterol/gamma-HCH transport system permease protein [Flavobacterium micromati]|jgi:phospholipid/cholesterol/gamma-HCH transport system permease protein|uniref:Phospholipid/cholesterol/gamma-HCH transport system permease protein n=1 Tax=Flavobacterium micromati TaxID=229205 RepID=A0A1M5I139_9FLAO|nr:ABC transporter permease [Flavobacterium micromati]MCL6460656.1 ABC transporter permease [Flavobacterium micromati]SHG21867.1 phospholipid/cholesterol/gamma-HCH transport system permease protein [Flavobacterium micromati]
MNTTFVEKKENLIQYFKEIGEDVGNVTLFSLRFFKEAIQPPYEMKEFVKQCYIIGYKSLPLVTITGFIMGLVLTLQSRPTLAKFGAESWLPSMVALSLIREIAPVITALICAGKVSSGIGAELGSMKVTEQIDAMEVSAINPFKYLVVTRILATTLMIPILVFYADAVGILGGYMGMNIHSEVSLYRYLAEVLQSIKFSDIFPATIKTFFFGFFIGMIGCYKGFNAANGTESVGKAANSAVVTASLSIFIIDMIAVQLTDLLI